MEPMMRRGAVAWLLTVSTVAGLAIDAYVHLHTASSYGLVRTATVSQADLFRCESALAILAALGVLLRPGWITGAAACVVGAGGVAAVTFYYYVDPGRLGPIPDMYEPVWYADKTWSFEGEALAAVTGLLLTLLYLRRFPGRARPGR